MIPALSENNMKKIIFIILGLGLCITWPVHAAFIEGAHFNNSSSSISGIAIPDPTGNGNFTPVEAYTSSTIVPSLHQALDGSNNGMLAYENWPSPGTGDFTVCTWAEFNSSFSGNDYRFLNFTNAAGDKLVGIDINWSGANGSLIFEGYDGTTFYAVSTSTDYRGTMHRFCGTQSNGVYKIYVDGSDVTTGGINGGSAKDFSSLSKMSVFESVPANPNNYADELSYFNNALSPTELSADYNSGLGIEYGSSTGPVLTAPTISSVDYPSYGMTTPDFSNWVYSLSNLLPGQSYYVKTLYEFASSSDPTLISDTTRYVDETLFIADTSSENYIPFPRNISNSLTPFNEWGTTYRWVTSILVYPTGRFDLMANVTSTFFVNLSTPTSSNSTSSQKAGPFNPTQNITQIPKDCSNFQMFDTYFGIPFFSSSSFTGANCYMQSFATWTFNQMVYPHDATKNLINSQTQQFKEVVPFKIFFKITDGLNTAIQNASSSSASGGPVSLTIHGLDYDQVDTLLTLDSSTLVTAFSTTHCTGTCPQNTKENIFGVLRATIWIVAGFNWIALLFA